MAGQNSKPQSSRARKAATKIVRRLQDAGHVAYFAGGSVRDMLLGHEASDHDVATDARPEQVRRLFRRSRLVGEAFGVVLVHSMEHQIEVATFRTEWGYADGRHPDHIQYSDAEHDARRRDFTVNGLFFDPIADQVHDFVGGRDDLTRGVIRAIGRPDERLAEDYLRLLRAVRFAARLDYQIEPQTADALRRFAPQLEQISRERIGMEVQLMFEHPTRAAAAQLLADYALDDVVLADQPVSKDPRCLTALDQPAHHPTALAAWLIDRHLKPQRPADRPALIDALERLKVLPLLRTWRRALMLSNEHRDALCDLLHVLPRSLRWPELTVAPRKRLLARADWPQLRFLLAPADALHDGAQLDLEQLDAESHQLQTEGVAPEPLINGDDLIAAGWKPSALFGTVLDQVYDAQLAGDIHSRDQAMALAKALADA